MSLDQPNIVLSFPNPRQDFRATVAPEYVVIPRCDVEKAIHFGDEYTYDPITKEYVFVSGTVDVVVTSEPPQSVFWGSKPFGVQCTVHDNSLNCTVSILFEQRPDNKTLLLREGSIEYGNGWQDQKIKTRADLDYALKIIKTVMDRATNPKCQNCDACARVAAILK